MTQYRLLIVATHPVQYAAPLFRRMAQHPQLAIQVAYCSLHGAAPTHDPGFGRTIQWDIPLLDGYPWVELPNRSPRPAVGPFWGLINPGIISLIRTGRFDAVMLLTGYMNVTFWLALAAAKPRGLPVLFGTDAHDTTARDGSGWKPRLKQALLPRIFRLADQVIVPSSAGVAYMQQLGIHLSRITLTPYVVDNDWWRARAAEADHAQTRQQWAIPTDAPVLLFCAKLQPWKRPLDVLHAFAQAAVPDSVLVFAGDGPLRTELEETARHLGLADRVRFLGFINQSQLPAVYTAADLFVLPSTYEPFGVVVNEAMLCGCPVVVSDRVGARADLIREGVTGYSYPCGDTAALAALVRRILTDAPHRAALRQAAAARMQEWSPDANVEAVVNAVAQLRQESSHP